MTERSTHPSRTPREQTEQAEAKFDVIEHATSIQAHQAGNLITVTKANKPGFK